MNTQVITPDALVAQSIARPSTAAGRVDVDRRAHGLVGALPKFGVAAGHMLRRLVISCVVVCAVALMVGTADPATALGYAHPNVVSANPVDYTPHVKNGTVRAVAVVGTSVYVGGTFTTVVNSGTSSQLLRNCLFAFDRGTGRVLSYAPSLDGVVETIAPAPDGASIIIGGQFRTVQGTAQRGLAILTADGRRVASFAARTNGYVNKLLVRGGRLVAGGGFSTANGVARANLAALTQPRERSTLTSPSASPRGARRATTP